MIPSPDQGGGGVVAGLDGPISERGAVRTLTGVLLFQKKNHDGVPRRGGRLGSFESYPNG